MYRTETTWTGAQTRHDSTGAYPTGMLSRCRATVLEREQERVSREVIRLKFGMYVDSNLSPIIGLLETFHDSSQSLQVNA